MALKRREKILLALGILAVSFFIFDLLYYTPRSRRIKSLEGEIKTAEQRLKEFTSLTKEIDVIDADIKKLEEEHRLINEKILKEDKFKVFLKHLSRQTDSTSMKIISIKPSLEEITIDKGKTAFNGMLKKFNVNMVLHSTFYKLQNYLREIEKLPLLVHLDEIQIEREEEIYPLLRVNLNINLYFISQE